MIQNLLLRYAGGYLMKRLLRAMLRRMIPTMVEFIEDEVKVWIDDPTTDTDDKAVEAVGAFLEHLLTRYVK